MLKHYHREADHVDMLLGSAGLCVQAKLKEQASCPVKMVAMQHYRCKVDLPRLKIQSCVFCGVLRCATAHRVLSSEDEN